MGGSSELDVIQQELDRLVEKRFETGLTMAEQHTYLRFAAREVELLDQQPATPARV